MGAGVTAGLRRRRPRAGVLRTRLPMILRILLVRGLRWIGLRRGGILMSRGRGLTTICSELLLFMVFVFFTPIPQPLTPGGGKGSLNSRFGGVASAVLLRFGAWRGLAQTIDGGGAHPMRALLDRSAAEFGALSFSARCLRQQASAGFGSPRHWGRAEQRSGGRIRAGACLSAASLRTTPPHASSARDPAGARSLARLFFGYFLLAKQKKVTRPPGRTPACHDIKNPNQ